MHEVIVTERLELHLLTLAGVILLIVGTALNVQSSRGTGD